MGRGMWILAALFAVLAIAMIYQDSTGGIERPWAECKESLVQQMFSSQCTPVTGLGGSAGGEPDGSQEPQQELGVGEIRRN